MRFLPLSSSSEFPIWSIRCEKERESRERQSERGDQGGEETGRHIKRDRESETSRHKKRETETQKETRRKKERKDEGGKETEREKGVRPIQTQRETTQANKLWPEEKIYLFK